jgi:ketosteroid isomerase-like protein
MTQEATRIADEAAIRAEIDAIAQAVQLKDVHEMLMHCAPDIVTFDMLPPLKHEGAHAIRRDWASALAPIEGPVEYEVRDLDIVVGGDVAFAHSLNRFGGIGRDGRRIVSWLRSTLGFRRIEGRWKLVHEHVSVPFDMSTSKALLNLQP